MKTLLRYARRAFCCWLLAAPLAGARAQAPAWAQVATGTHTTGLGALASVTTAVATDASGDVFVTGMFKGTATFGSTVLVSQNGDSDMFVAKYLSATNTWAWAQRGGGNFSDRGAGLVLSGGSVYVVSTFNSGFTPGFTNMTFGGTTAATSPVPLTGFGGFNIVVAKYTDQGTSAALGWVQALPTACGTSGEAIAADGPSLYVAGNGGGDWYLTKLTDAGRAASQGWTYAGGGLGTDVCAAIAARGPNLYLTGYITNTSTNAQAVTFGSAGRPAGVVVNGVKPIASPDLVLFKYLDQGATATLQWVQVAGGTQADAGRGVAVRGTSVYVTGHLTNNTENDCGVVLAGTAAQVGATPLITQDLLLAKYTDNGTSATLNWAQVAGADREDSGEAVAVSGTSVYVAGSIFGGPNQVYPPYFGGAGNTIGTQTLIGQGIGHKDLVVAKYLDNGPTATVQWAQVAGGGQVDEGLGVAVSGQSIFAVGSVMSPANFGALPLASAAPGSLNVLARLVDNTLLPLAAAPAAPAAGAALYPNPAHGAATLGGVAPGAAVQVLDGLGRVVATATADATGTARVAAGLAPGVYAVRAGSAALRLTVE
ncbi:MAG TPA: hypothetical protein VFO93_08085 [Hymenobacter sp.]|uniref:hypothetical protein n=1 Tax=Hymenobacter sp. TaxID=1898978 RepID=UPI002D7EFBDB|nr:hypothetical protein [Hymenobacter sp.]HET9503485.1 hypothetical protein [Hymenobacter sp.]